MNSAEIIRKKYMKKLDRSLKYIELHKFDKEKIQKMKFKLISELIVKLFKYKNCKESYANISSLIVLFLTIFEENYPIDIYNVSNEDNLSENYIIYRNILKEEFTQLN